MRSAFTFTLTIVSIASLVWADQSPEVPASASQPENQKASKLAALTDVELSELLRTRLSGEMGMTFGQFGNMFLVQSRLMIGTGIGLMADEKKIIRSQLQSPFPESYHPTLREFLDAIALQSFSEWKYDPTDKHFKSDLEEDEPVRGLAIFEFKSTKRKKPFSIKLAEDWKANDKGNWVMYVPTAFPVGMDIYEMGRYSTDEKEKEAFFEKIRSDVALEWAKRVNPEAQAEDLKPAKVGMYDALAYDTLLKNNGKKIRWRHWVLMADDRCFFIVSTIIPRLEDEIFPDVEAMIQSFTMEK